MSSFFSYMFQSYWTIFREYNVPCFEVANSLIIGVVPACTWVFRLCLRSLLTCLVPLAALDTSTISFLAQFPFHIHVSPKVPCLIFLFFFSIKFAHNFRHVKPIFLLSAITKSLRCFYVSAIKKNTDVYDKTEGQMSLEDYMY